MPASMSPPTRPDPAGNPGLVFAQAILPLLARLPERKEQTSRTPMEAARKRANTAAAKAALEASALALSPVEMGWLRPACRSWWAFGRFRSSWWLTSRRSMANKKRCPPAGGVLPVSARRRARAARSGGAGGSAHAGAAGFALACQQHQPAHRCGLGQVRIGPVGPALAADRGGGLGVGAYAHHDTTQVAATAIGLYDGVVEGDVVLADDSPTA